MYIDAASPCALGVWVRNMFDTVLKSEEVEPASVKVLGSVRIRHDKSH